MRPENYTAQIREILASYSTGKIYRISRVSRGFANINFIAETDTGRYLVRFCRKQSLENIEKEVLLMQVLQKHNFPTAYPLPDRTGKVIHPATPFPVMVYPFLSGKQPQPLDEEIRQVAEALARLHTIPPDKVPQKKNSIDPARCFSLITRHESGRCANNELIAMWVECFRKAEPCLSKELPIGLIHGDLFPDNTLFDNRNLVAILDFEEFAIDTYLFDIGMAMNGFCLTDNIPDKRKIDLFLSSYEPIRPLVPAEKACLDAYIIWTALGMACWHIRDCLHQEKPEQKKRIRELILMACNRANPSKP